MLKITDMISEEECYKRLRLLRWPDGQVKCPRCCSTHCDKMTVTSFENPSQSYKCNGCSRHFNDLTGTIFRFSKINLKSWMCCLYLMGLNVSNRQIAQELGVSERSSQRMTNKIRKQILKNSPEPNLAGEVEFDEVYIVAGHKGNPAAVKKKGRIGRRRRLKGSRGRGTLEKEKPPILGMIQRGGEVVIRMLANVQQVTIKPIIEQFVQPGTVTYTDEYDIYNRLNEWGYERHSVCHSKGEYARDDDGDGFCEVHVNTMEGFWSLLRSWLRPHRGISQEKLPMYLGFFEAAHNIRKRGRGLLEPMLQLILL